LCGRIYLVSDIGINRVVVNEELDDVSMATGGCPVSDCPTTLQTHTHSSRTLPEIRTKATPCVEVWQGKKKEETDGKKIMSASAMQGGHNQS